MAFESLSQLLNRIKAGLRSGFGTRQSAEQLEHCLDTIDWEQQPEESAFERDPLHAARPRTELEADLQAAGWLMEVRSALDPPADFVENSRLRMLERLEVPHQPWYARMEVWLAGYTRGQLTGRLVLACLLLLSIWFSMDRFVQSSHTALPGDLSYPLKISSESLRLGLTLDAAGKAELHTIYARQRLMEVQALAFEGRYEQIPATVVGFENHVNGAVRAVSQVSSHDMVKARQLALAYQLALESQNDLLSYISGGVPLEARSQFEHVRLVSQDSASELEKVLAPDSGDAEILTSIMTTATSAR